jgi:hypothetical protein
MICGPAIIVMARGRICRFMALTLAFLLGLGGRVFWQGLHAPEL